MEIQKAFNLKMEGKFVGKDVRQYEVGKWIKYCTYCEETN